MWNLPVNISVRCNFFLFFCFRRSSWKVKDSKSCTFNPEHESHSAALDDPSEHVPEVCRTSYSVSSLFLHSPPPSLPSAPPLHTPCHSSADGWWSDTWRMLGNQRDSWLPSRGALLQNTHTHSATADLHSHSHQHAWILHKAAHDGCIFSNKSHCVHIIIEGVAGEFMNMSIFKFLRIKSTK